jgi:tetratricopeptide (TPR) repeat protein
MMVWFHHYEQSNETIQLITRTIHSVFPHVECFLTVESDVIGLASMEPLKPDFAAMEACFDLPAVRQDLARVGVYNLASVLGYHGVTPARFAATVGEGPLNTDDHQRLEYLGARNMFLGRDADLLDKDRGFDTLADGRTDSLLDRYIAWRAAQGEPMHQGELRVATAANENILTKEHRLAMLVHQRRDEATDAGEGSKVARGKRVPVSEMGFSEAFNWGQYVAAVDGMQAALPYFQRALECEPKNSGAALAVASVMQADGKLEDAIAVLNRSIESGTTRTDAHLQLARIAIRGNRYEDAKRLLTRLIDIEENSLALMLMGELVGGMQNDMAAAKNLFKRAILRDARLTVWQATMNYTQILKMEATAELQAANSPPKPEDVLTPADHLEAGRALLEEALSEIRYALFHNPGVADLQTQQAQLQALLGTVPAKP